MHRFGLGIKPVDFNPTVLFAFRENITYESELEQVHQHDYISIIYCTSGNCTYYIDSLPYELNKHDILVINANRKHYMELGAGGEVCLFNMGVTNFKRRQLPMNHMLDENVTPLVTNTKYDDEFYNCYREIINLQESKEIGWKHISKTIVMKMIILLLKETYEPVSEDYDGYLQFDSFSKEAIVNTIIEYFEKNYMYKISLDTITRNTYLSSVYISKIFKDRVGDTPINYLIHLRLDKAKDLLQEGVMPVNEVAMRVGYKDSYYFSKIFKKHIGISPTKYKNSYSIG